MSKLAKNQSQARTIGEIATMLHTKRRGVADLISRSDNPLPLPHHVHESDQFVVDSAYRHKLLCWVQKEKLRRAKDSADMLDFSLIERELSSRNRRARWSIDDDLEETPPGNYFG